MLQSRVASSNSGSMTAGASDPTDSPLPEQVRGKWSSRFPEATATSMQSTALSANASHPTSKAGDDSTIREGIESTGQDVPGFWRCALSRWQSYGFTAPLRRLRWEYKGANPFILSLLKFGKFIGPGFMVAVAYIDPGNYSTDVAAGANAGFKLLFIVLMSNIFAVVLQSLAVRLGTVTGMNLAEHCRANLPRWLNYVLYGFAEAAIIATDIAEVIGSAIAFNLLFKIPLVAGCILTMVDVLVILFFYRPDGNMRGVRIFEYFVAAMVLTVVVCFCIQLSFISNTSVGEVFKGYLPSSAVIEGQGIYLSCGILGATVMPHSLYLGSGIVQPRLKEYDESHPEARDTTPIETDAESILDNTKPTYRPSLNAIKYCMRYSIVELVISLTVFALFVNSSILIVAGASFHGNTEAQDADLFSIYSLLSSTIAPAAGTIFAVALLFSGTSAGIVCTIAGQMVSEGQIRWKLKPWLRRLITRSLSITPSVIIAGSIGQRGLGAALNASQVTLSATLPFVTAPLVYFTCRNKFMTVRDGSNSSEESLLTSRTSGIGMRNHFLLSTLAVLIWLVITVMNGALVVLAALGKV